MWIDPIVEEIHRIREEYAASFNHDLQAICEDLKQGELESIQAGRKVVSRAPKKTHTEPPAVSS